MSLFRSAPAAARRQAYPQSYPQAAETRAGARHKARLPAPLAAFLREEDGVAFITFGTFIGFLLIVLCAFAIDNVPDQKNRGENNDKQAEYSTLVTDQYNLLYLKRALCSNNSQTANCGENSDATNKIFAKKLSDYTYGGNGSDPQAEADMQEYLNKAFNEDIGRFRFQKSKPPKVSISCHKPTNRLLLTFTTVSPSFNYFWKNQSDLKSEAKRLSNVPCEFNDPRFATCVGSQCSATPQAPPGLGSCAHGKKTRKESKPGLESEEYSSGIASNSVNLGTVRSVVNFVVSLDARSKRELGGVNNGPSDADNFISRFGGSLLNASGLQSDMSQLAAGMTIGNYPMRGGGVPDCADNQSQLKYSGSCNDNGTEFSTVTRASVGDTGLANTNRKGDMTGEFRAQYTRRCPSNEARWTYEVGEIGTCREENYLSDSHIFPHQVSSDPRLATDSGRNEVATEQFAANGGASYCTDRGAVDTLSYDIDSNTPVPGNPCGLDADAVAAGQYCYRFAINCIRPDPRQQSVMQGRWYASCRSETLGANPANFYNEPVSYLDFRAKLVADLEVTPVTEAKHKAVELQATITKSLTPNLPKAVDAAALQQVNELVDLHAKNTERSFYWACENGPVDTATGRPAANDGNLGTPEGTRVNNRDLLKDDGSQTPHAQNILVDNTGKRGCAIPVIGTPTAGKMTGTVNYYDLTFKRKDCTGGTDCGIPEGMYALSLKPASPLQTVVTPDENKRYPDRLLKTSWRPTGNAPDQYKRNGDNTVRWAWQNIGTVSNLGAECPLTGDPSTNCTNPLIGISGTRYCGSKNYDTTYHTHLGDCDDDNGSGCPNIARYISTATDVVYRDMLPERLNITSVALERRIVPDASGAPTPYTCTFDKGETSTSKRSNFVQIAGGPQSTNPTCDWKNNANFFCQKNSGSTITPDQVEQKFIDDNDSGGVTGGGIFSLTAKNFTSDLLLGDDAEEFGNQSQKTNFKTRKITSGKLKAQDDPNMGLMPFAIQTEEVVRYHNTDLAPDNMEIVDRADQFTNVVKEIAKGYAPYDIFSAQNGNQCALYKQGLRTLWSGVDGTVPASKFVVWIGSLPTAQDYKTTVLPDSFSMGKPISGTKPGEYVDAEMRLKSKQVIPPSILASTTPGVDIVKKCFSGADKDGSTTPFFVTTIGSSAASSEVEETLSALETVTANTTNESCKRPFCLLSAMDGKLNGVEAQNIMTPETCAAKLWRCISPASTKF